METGRWLVWRDVDGERRAPLPPGEWTIGRGEDCDIVVRDFGLSRRHARLIVTGDEVRVVDLKSKGGTQVNVTPVLEAPLRPGDRLRLGTVECRLEQASAVGDIPGLVAAAHGQVADDQAAALAPPLPEPPRGPIHLVRDANVTIAENAAFVLRELDGIDVPEELRQRVRSVWRELSKRAAQVQSTIDRLEARCGQGVDPGALEAIEASLGQALVDLDDLVRTLGHGGGPPSRGLLSILVTESAANVVTAFLRSRRGTRELLDSWPVEAPARRPGEETGAPRTWRKHEILCASCGSVAASVEVGAHPFASGEEALVYSGLVRRQAFSLRLADEVFTALADGRLGEVHGLLGDEGIDAYCPECAAAYCAEHYRLETRYDEDFYDCTYGTCPGGHRRMIDD